MHVVVIGLAVTGEAVARHALSEGDAVTVLEDHPATTPAYRERAARLVDAGGELVELADAGQAAALAAHADLVVPSPGVRPEHPAVTAARAAGVPVRSEVDVAVERARRQTAPPRLVAVTGTNGKTTVTTLVAAMLDEAGVRNTAAGNIGRPLVDAVTDPVDVVVAEVSSFQLELTTDAFAPDVAVLLNVAEDHLDWHGSFAAYAEAKARVFAHQRADGLLVVNADDPIASELADAAPGRVVRYRAGPPLPGGYGVMGDRLIGPAGDIAAAPAPLVPHDRSNALAAAAAAIEVGAHTDAIGRALGNFAGLAHRVQLVGEVGAIRFYDDSKATNPHATAAALRGFEHAVLIAGGRNKALDLSVLREHAGRVDAVVTIGEAASEVEAAFAGAVPVVRANSMREAVRLAAEHVTEGGAVLLSPACASFDWYESYAARGDDFAREVASLSEDSTCSSADGGRA
jgi:UDP-N-acetylmuramoylalanine--D-glutamate ligase